MTDKSIEERTAVYSSLLTGPIPPEMDGTPEELAQRITDSIAAICKPEAER